MDTYGKSCQLGASRRRLEDAVVLHNQERWTGATYLGGGYAIECSLKSLICHVEGEYNLKDTKAFQNGLQGVSLHNLTNLLNALPVVQRAIQLDRTGTYREAWKLVSSVWLNDELRYSDKTGDGKKCEKFINAVKVLHRFLLDKQQEVS